MRNGFLAVLCGVVMLSAPAVAQTAVKDEDLRTVVDELRRTIEQQGKRLAELEGKQDEEHLKRISREEVLKVLKEMNADVGGRSALPKWMENLTFYGDLRLRYEAACWASHSGFGDGVPATDTTNKTRNRARYRLRFGVVKTWEDWEVGFRLAAGEADTQELTTSGGHTVKGVATGYSNATSTDQTFTGLFGEKPIWVDLAYATWKPKAVKGLQVTGGKMSNPFHSSDIIWDSDINPEGVYGRYTAWQFGNFEPFVGAGYFIAKETGQALDNAYDTVLAAYDTGFGWKVAKDVKWTFAATYYDWDHYDTSGASASGNDPGWRRSAGRQDWNFAVVDLMNKLDLKVLNLPLCLYFDWAHNLADDDANTGFRGKDDAYAVGAKLGANKKAGDWSVGYKYAYIEANAVPGVFADSTFAGTNRKGHVVSGFYNITDNLTAGVSVFLTEPIRSTTGEDDQVVVQADLVWKF